MPIATLNFQSHTHAYPSKINLPSDWNRVSLASQPFTKTNISYASRKSNIQKHDAVLCCSFLFRSVPLRACSAPRSQESHVPGRDRVINRPKGGTPKRGRFLGGTFRLSAATRAKLVFKAVIIYRWTVSRDSQLHIRFRSRFSLFSFVGAHRLALDPWRARTRATGWSVSRDRRANSRDGTNCEHNAWKIQNARMAIYWKNSWETVLGVKTSL